MGLGEVKEGYRADLILIAGDPLADLNALRHPVKVILAGRVVHERREAAASPSPPRAVGELG
jgi:imidazolonepropionase-like amidohydrolase